MPSDWEKVGEQLPVKDDSGIRPLLDEDGKARDTEIVLYEPLAYLEFIIDDLASAKDRRFLNSTLESLSAQNQLAPAFAANFELTFMTVCRKFIKSVRLVDGSKECSDKEAMAFLSSEIEFDDALQILVWLRQKASLEASKKKSLRQPSG
jgi:hypothetical protein